MRQKGLGKRAAGGNGRFEDTLGAAVKGTVEDEQLRYPNLGQKA